MATKDEMMEAAKAFWGPLKPGQYEYGQHHDIQIFVSAVESLRTITLHDIYIVGGYWSTGDINLLQLQTSSKLATRGRRAEIAELLFWIVAEGAKPPADELPHTGPPETILDLITTEYDKKTGRTWLIGELYDDRVEIQWEWEDFPFRIGLDGLHARWMDGKQTWLELSADPMAEYNRVFRRPIEAEEVPEIRTSETKLDKLQAAIDDIERDIRQLRAKEHDFTSTNIEMARRVGKQNEYEELLRQRDEHMWRENPTSQKTRIAMRHMHIPRELTLAFWKPHPFTSLESALPIKYIHTKPVKEPVFTVVPVPRHTDDTGLSVYATYKGAKFLARYKAHGADLVMLRVPGGFRDRKELCMAFQDMLVNSGDLGPLGITIEYDDGKDIIYLQGDQSSHIHIIIDQWSDRPFFQAKLYEEEVWYYPEVVTCINLKEHPETEYNRIFNLEHIIKEEELPEIQIERTRIDDVQREIDSIEDQIRRDRASTRDFDTDPMAVAEKLGIRERFETLLKERDELMWREK